MGAGCPGPGEGLLAEVCSIDVALTRLPAPQRAVLAYRYGPPRGATDRELADALDVESVLLARAVVLAALLAFGGQLARMGLVDMSGRPKWRG